jgi:hypothetical protein
MDDVPLDWLRAVYDDWGRGNFKAGADRLEPEFEFSTTSDFPDPVRAMQTGTGRVSGAETSLGCRPLRTSSSSPPRGFPTRPRRGPVPPAWSRGQLFLATFQGQMRARPPASSRSPGRNRNGGYE